LSTLVRGPARPAGHPSTDQELLEQVLRPYRPHCRYLKSVEVTAAGEPAEGGRVSVTGGFEIPESCYIDDTGHFNSVEFNICYNQMFYYLAAKSVAAGLVRPFSGWTMADFWRRQLSDFLIVDFRSTFRRAISSRRFSGEVAIVDIVDWAGSDVREPLTVVRTECRYWDDHGGSCRGEVKLAVTGSAARAAGAGRP
jgi:hypothetical protein